jgi:hypothetical protein
VLFSPMGGESGLEATETDWARRRPKSEFHAPDGHTQSTNTIHWRRLSTLLEVTGNSGARLEGAGKIILRNECASGTYTTQVIADMIKEEAKGRFEALEVGSAAISSPLLPAYPSMCCMHLMAIRKARTRSMELTVQARSFCGTNVRPAHTLPR